MATTYISVALNDQRIMDIDALKKSDGIPNETQSGGMTRDMYVKKLLLEKIDDKLLKLKSAKPAKKTGGIING
jgi:hypothetical protein